MQTDLAFSCAPGDPKLVTKGCMLQVFSGNAIRLGAKHIDLDLFIIYWAVFFLVCQAWLQKHIGQEKRGNWDPKRTYQGRSMAYFHDALDVEKSEICLL